MRISALASSGNFGIRKNNKSFQGREVKCYCTYHSCCIEDGNRREASNCTYDGPSGVTYPIKECVEKLHPAGEYANIDYTNALTNNTPKRKEVAYFADPDETLDEKAKEKYCFIVYDGKPDMPTLEQLDTKFHTKYESPEDYNTAVKLNSRFYRRKLKSDGLMLAKFEAKLLEDTEKLERAEEERDRIHSSYYSKKEKDEADYFVYFNKQEIEKDKEKINYYKIKNEDTKKMINYSNGLLNILNETGDLLIKRDELARKRNESFESKTYMEKTLPLIVTEIKENILKRNETSMQIQFCKMKIDNIRERAKQGYSKFYNYVDLRNDNEKIEKLKKEIESKKLEIENYQKKIQDLKTKKADFEKDIIKENAKIENINNQIYALVDKADVIFQKVKAYYAQNI